jgi:hypothetical protein
MTESEKFDNAMDAILKANPRVVKQQMEDDARIRQEARKAKRASLDPDPDDPV